MTSCVDIIRSQLRTVVGDILSVTVEYRKLTSRPGVEPRIWGSWANVNGVLSGNNNRQEYDERRKAYISAQTVTLRLTDQATKLVHGDQVRITDVDASKVIYAVDAIDGGGYGSVRYVLSRAEPLIASGGDRGGGL